MFEIFQSEKSKEFFFRLKAKNGQTILSSEGYKTKSACQNGIESVKSNAPEDRRYDRQMSKDGKFYFNLKAANGQVIGSSQRYTAENSRENGIDSVKRNAPSAPLSDLTVAASP
ncbi:YegP family protein [Pontibacter sp. G13]|uniref:YegP family protein n=1 Tax=Pontibacter sp. G13 TaxID=3074898 RepID=UPI00288A0098|nr:YegP family protein [Pontibacter sp. G13]WNJ20890.1 YegP family protein [Pontibacter sp. G13]